MKVEHANISLVINRLILDRLEMFGAGILIVAYMSTLAGAGTRYGWFALNITYILEFASKVRR